MASNAGPLARSFRRVGMLCHAEGNSPRAGDTQHDAACVLPFPRPRRESLIPAARLASPELIRGRYSKAPAVPSIAGIPRIGRRVPPDRGVARVARPASTAEIPGTGRCGPSDRVVVDPRAQPAVWWVIVDSISG